MKVQVEANPEEAARAGARLIAEQARNAVAERGLFALAASGGTDPWTMYAALAEEEVPWRKVAIFQVDERVAPDGDEDRNLTHLLEALPAEARERVQPMPVTVDGRVAVDEVLENGAERYGTTLPDQLDLVHLGLGPDGHTASLVPGDPVLEVTGRPVALTARYDGRRRMTLTYPALNAARLVFWLTTGESKRDPIAKLLDGDSSIPAARVRPQEGLVITDKAGAPENLEQQ